MVSNNKPVIECRSVYKIFGSDVEKVIQKNQGQLDLSQFQSDDYVIGVEDVSLEVSRGEILVVMGLSGSGKSTLVRCLSRLIDCTSGEIFLDGEDLLKKSVKELIEIRRHKMGMVFQNFALLPHKTVLENIAFPLQIRGKKLHESFDRARQMIDLVGLNGRESSFPRELSGGQQQRVGIARSLAVEPEVWFLDEPFSALDPLIRQEMQDEFLRLQSMLQKTIVFITHDFGEALRLADRIAIMYNGKIEQMDTPENIVLNPATDYVRKFTNDVPREKVLTAISVMDDVIENQQLSDFRVPSEIIIEKIAEKVLLERHPVGVVDKNQQLIGTLNPEKVVHLLFGEKNTEKQ